MADAVSVDAAPEFVRMLAAVGTDPREDTEHEERLPGVRGVDTWSIVSAGRGGDVLVVKMISRMSSGIPCQTRDRNHGAPARGEDRHRDHGRRPA
jgi:hypothetical protein